MLRCRGNASIDRRDRFCERSSVKHRAVRVQHRRQRIRPSGLCHGAGNAIKLRQCRKRRCVEQIDIPLRKRFGLLAMISEGIFRVQRFAGA